MTDASDPDQTGFGDSRVDAAVSRLDDLADLLVGDHPGVYDAVNGRLREVLSGLDDDSPA